VPSCKFIDRIMPNMISRNGKLKTHPLPHSEIHIDNQNTRVPIQNLLPHLLDAFH